ncbi:MAG TPA: histone deacetylase [Gemmatimonadales bacterium]|nr:histone deacetylase [Gemmatimonadales bacterium]
MKAYYTDQFVLPLPQGHRFPMAKYGMLRARVAAAQLASLEVPAAATDTDLQRVHTPDYVRRVSSGALDPAEQRTIGFPWSPAMVERSRRSAGATLAAARQALVDGVAVSLAGGTHHAFPDHGEGFCVFNDVAVAVRVLQAEALARQVLIVDCDVHQGNGTAAILAGDEDVFTLDLFAEKNYPFRKEAPDLAVPLPDGSGDALYLDRLGDALPRAIAAARPDLAIYVSGADPHAGDRLGRLGLTKDGLEERDRTVLGTLRRQGVPVAVTMAGGYGRNLQDTVDIHFATVLQAAHFSAGAGVRLRSV